MAKIGALFPEDLSLVATNSNVFEWSGSLHLNFFQKMLSLAFEANSALFRENETKIVKITHSVWPKVPLYD